jgi:hypothetical protein
MDLVAPYLRKRIDSFLQEEALEAFRADINKAVEEKTEVLTFSLMGNSYGLKFFEELAPFVEKLVSIKVYSSLTRNVF